MTDNLPVNPFTPVAVAQTTELEQDRHSIDTDPIRQAKAYLIDYLTSADTGRVMAVVGDYGTGKTHLVMELMRHARAVTGEPSQAMYLDATADNFISLYQRFIDRLPADELLGRVNRLYAAIVADALHASGVEAPTEQWLRNGELEPRLVVDRLGLPESTLLRRVQQKLLEVTGHDAFSRALTLLLRTGFETSVRGWLRGGPIDPVLAERGIITRRLDTEDAALEIMGAFAQLFTADGQRYLLVIDELDKILSTATEPGTDTMGAFHTLLRLYNTAGALLVLSGLPDFLTVLRGDVRQRITYQVDMSGLDTEQVCSYVEDAQERSNGEARLAPFDRDTIGYLVRLADGNPRMVIRLCHHVFRRWSADRRPVTDEMIREVAREYMALTSIDDVSAATARLLEANNWAFLRNHFLGATPETKVDYWITFTDSGPGCAVLITNSVLDGRDADRLIGRALALRKVMLDVRTLLIVNGVLSEDLADLLAGVFTRPPVIYQRLVFEEHLGAVLRMIAADLSPAEADSPIESVRARLEQLTRQQASIHGFIERIAERMHADRAEVDGRFDAVDRALAALTETVRLGTPSTSDLPAPVVALPASVDELFTDALAKLDRLLRIDELLAGEFAPETDVPAPSRLSANLGEMLEPTAVAMLLRSCVCAFRDATTEWYGTTGGRLTVTAEERLDQLCLSFERLSEQLPVVRLERLAGAASGELIRTLYNLSIAVRYGFG